MQFKNTGNFLQHLPVKLLNQTAAAHIDLPEYRTLSSLSLSLFNYAGVLSAGLRDPFTHLALLLIRRNWTEMNHLIRRPKCFHFAGEIRTRASGAPLGQFDCKHTLVYQTPLLNTVLNIAAEHLTETPSTKRRAMCRVVSAPLHDSFTRHFVCDFQTHTVPYLLWKIKKGQMSNWRHKWLLPGVKKEERARGEWEGRMRSGREKEQVTKKERREWETKAM